jgi:hypothetical protein
LSDEVVIRRVATSFVPVAVNLYKVRHANDAAGKLFRSVQQQKDQYQGIWIVSPDGKVLAGHHQFKSDKTWKQEVIETVDTSLREFGTVVPRDVRPTNPLPFRGYGVQSDGNVCLAIYARQMMGGGRQSAPPGTSNSRLWIWDGKLRPDGPVVIDSLTLGADDWECFAPRKTEPAVTWSIPDAVTRRFCRVLIPSSDQSAMPLPEDTKVATLTASIESVEREMARIRLTGAWEALHLIEGDATRAVRGVATAEGVAVYDLKQRAMQSFLLVSSGIHGRPQDESASANGAVIEWHRENTKKEP